MTAATEPGFLVGAKVVDRSRVAVFEQDGVGGNARDTELLRVHLHDLSRRWSEIVDLVQVVPLDRDRASV